MKNEEHLGHPSYEHWNVSLWLNNTEESYQAMAEIAEDVCYMNLSLAKATEELMEILPEKTGDGVFLTNETVRYTLKEMVDEMIQYS